MGFLEGSSGKQYAKFDESGIPTHAEDGAELSKSARKGCEKEHAKQSKLWNELKEKQASDECFLEKLQLEVIQLEKELNQTTSNMVSINDQDRQSDVSAFAL